MLSSVNYPTCTLLGAVTRTYTHTTHTHTHTKRTHATHTHNKHTQNTQHTHTELSLTIFLGHSTLWSTFHRTLAYPLLHLVTEAASDQKEHFSTTAQTCFSINGTKQLAIYCFLSFFALTKTHLLLHLETTDAFRNN